uniref:Uncharacterized protein n=1 Tax=Panthera leo TaxID=9689 RepID=A0A8C8YFA6_PANLE
VWSGWTTSCHSGKTGTAHLPPKASAATGFLAHLRQASPQCTFLCCRPCARGLDHCYCLSKPPTDSKDRPPTARCYHRESGSDNYWSHL